MDDIPKENCYLGFRQFFTIKSEGRAALYISAEGQYAAFLNGVYLPSTQYTDFPFYKSVQRIFLAPLIAGGRNELRIEVLYPGVDTSVTRREQPGLRFELWQEDELLGASGDRTEVCRMSGYRSGPVHILTPQLGYGFVYENPKPEHWQRAVAVDKECETVFRPVPELEVGHSVMTRLISQGIFTNHSTMWPQYAGLHYRELDSMLTESGTDRTAEDVGFSAGPGPEGMRPETRFPSENGVHFRVDEGDGIFLVFDLKEEMTGYLELDITCPFPTNVNVSYGEHLEDLRVRSDVGGRHFSFRWEAQSSRKRFVHRFHRLGGRYLQLLIHSREAVVYHAGLIPAEYPMRADGKFRCGDHLHNRIFEVAKHTLRCCVHEHYEDCPWREQALYAFDSRNQMLFGYYAFGEFAQPRASLKLLALSQREDGLLELCAPARLEVDIPAFSLMFIVELEEYCRYSGDLAFGGEMLPVAARILRTVHEHFRDGLVWNFREPQYWNFYEWRPLLEGTPIERAEEIPPSAEAPLQLFYLLALERFQMLCGYLGKTADGIWQEAEALVSGLEQFWDPQENAYASFIRDGRRIQYAELVQALALYTGAVPGERLQHLRMRLAYGGLVPVSMSASIFKYDALLQEPERYGTAVFEEVAERWGEMLYQGATAFWETDAGAEDFERAGSLCHAWSSIPVYLYGAYVLGVRPERPGVWRAYDPVPSGIREAWGKLYPPQGEMEIRQP